MPINKKELTKEQIVKAVQCKTADELMELDSEKLKKIAGGIETCWAVDGCSWHC